MNSIKKRFIPFAFFLITLFNLNAQPVSKGGGYYYPRGDGGSFLVSVIGYKGQIEAPLIDEQGRMLLEANNTNVGKFALVDNKTSAVNWTYDNDYYPTSVHEFSIPNFNVQLKYFAYPRSITTIGQWNGNFVLMYVRARLTYTGSTFSGTETVNIGAPTQLTPINEAAKGQTNPLVYDRASRQPIVLDYAIATERISGIGSHSLTSTEIQQISGSLDAVESEYKSFWDTELSRMESFTIPQGVAKGHHLTNAHKVSLIHMQIVRDGDIIHVGENGYDAVFDHDAQGVMASAIEMGALTQSEAEVLIKNLPAQRADYNYIDALGKLPWAVAKFAQKFQPSNAVLNDLVFTHQYSGSESMKKSLSGWVHYMINNKLEADGLAVYAYTLDSYNRATVDNLAVLLGLKSYQYLCKKLGNTAEANWAENQFNTTSAILQNTLKQLVQSKAESEKYISVGVNILTENITNFTNGGIPDPFANANAYSHFFFGRMYELFLLGGNLDQLTPYIDNTLDIGLKRVANDSRFMVNGQWNGNFGIYDNNQWCTNGYNASYTEGLLLGKGKYRDAFYKSFNYLMDFQTGPYTWFESIGCGYNYNVNVQGVPVQALGGGGSAPHIWSSMSQARMFSLTLISEKYDGTVIIGRGVPSDWLNKGSFGASNYKLSNGSRFSYSINATANKEYTFSYTGTPNGEIVLNLIPFLSTTPQIISYPGAPSDYYSKVRLVDTDNDGSKEIVIDPSLAGKQIVFSLSNAAVIYRIKNRWQNTYLYDAGDRVRYSATPSGNTYNWVMENIGGGEREIKNAGTGDYIHIENLMGYVQSSSKTSGWLSSRWTTEDAGSGYIRLKNVWQPTNYIHIENLASHAQHGVIQNGWLSAMWILEPVAGARETSPDVTDSDKTVSIWPTIVETELHIQSDGSYRSIEVIDMMGKIHHKDEKIEGRKSITLDLAHLRAGVHLVKLRGIKKSNTIRIIKN